MWQLVIQTVAVVSAAIWEGASVTELAMLAMTAV